MIITSIPALTPSLRCVLAMSAPTAIPALLPKPDTRVSMCGSVGKRRQFCRLDIDTSLRITSLALELQVYLLQTSSQDVVRSGRMCMFISCPEHS